MRHTNLKSLSVVVFLITLTSSSAFAFSDWWQCSSRVGGEWNFGRAPSACLVDHMQKQSFVKEQYSGIIFDDTASKSSERRRYMNELHSVALEMSHYYLKRRKPGVSQSEISAFALGVQALMQQETWWSHYRNGNDSKVRYMRGDSGHGHGLMQVDDRSHQSALLAGKGADLVLNMVYGLDVFFNEWERAPNQWCVDGPTDYTARIRSAWAAYNGGPPRICRWTQTTGTFAHHDKDFLNKLNAKRWMDYVADPDKSALIDVACLAEGERPCAPPTAELPTDNPVENELYKDSAGDYCVVNNNTFECVTRLHDVNCLQLRENRIYSKTFALSEVGESALSKKILDPHQLCLKTVDGLIPVARTLKINKNINVRKTPGGELLKTLQSDSTYSILDFAVTTTQDQQRYYQLNFGSDTGYVFAGDANTYAEWAEEVTPPAVDPIVAQAGDQVEIAAPFGINIRDAVQGSLIGHIPKGDTAEVGEIVVRGDLNYVYYLIRYNNIEGYIYSGYLDGAGTVKDWTRVLVDQQHVGLQSHLSYQYLKSCPSHECRPTDHAIQGQSIDRGAEPVIVTNTNAQWSFVQSLDGLRKGWIETSALTAL